MKMLQQSVAAGSAKPLPVRDATDDPALLDGGNALVIAVEHQPDNIFLWHLRQLLPEDVLQLKQNAKLDGVTVIDDDVELDLTLLFLTAHQAVTRHDFTMVQRRRVANTGADGRGVH